MKVIAAWLIFLICIGPSFVSADLPIERRSERCPQIQVSDDGDLIRFSPSGEFTVTISNFAKFGTPAAGVSDRLEVNYQAIGYFGEGISQTQTLAAAELDTNPFKAMAALVPIIHNKNDTGEMSYDVIAEQETLVNYADFATNPSARSVLHITRDVNFNSSTALFGATRIIILISPQGIVCEEPTSSVAPLGGPLQTYKLMSLFHESMSDGGRLAQEALAAVRSITEERDRLLGEQEQLDRQSGELTQQLEQVTADLAIQVDTTNRAIEVAKRKAAELAVAESEVERLRMANGTLGTTLSKLLKGVFRLQKAIYRGLSVERTYKKLRKLQRKAEKDLNN